MARTSFGSFGKRVKYMPVCISVIPYPLQSRSRVKNDCLKVKPGKCAAYTAVMSTPRSIDPKLTLMLSAMVCAEGLEGQAGGKQTAGHAGKFYVKYRQPRW